MNIGIDLGGSHIGVGIIDGCNLLNTVDKFFTEEDRKDIENAIIRNIDELINNVLNQSNLNITDVQKIGVSSPGTVIDGKIRSSNLGLNYFDLKSVLEEKYKLPVKVRNDGKCAALAEKKYGIMKDYDDCVFVNIGTGVGGAAFIGGKLLEPKRFSGFEFGHMVIKKDGLACNCGRRGCFEKYASMKVLRENIAKEVKNNNLTGEEIRTIIQENKNEKINKIVDEYIENLSLGLTNLINIFEPEIISIGGSFVYYEKELLGKLKDRIKQEQLFNKENVPKIVLAKLKNDAGMVGSVLE